MSDMRAYVVRQENDQVVGGFETVTTEQLGAGTVLIKTAYSAVNYKDYLATLSKGGVIRDYPMVPGIDVSGEVVASEDVRFQVGDQVLVTGYELGTKHPGGFASHVNVSADWVVKLPTGLNMLEAMEIGTAGFTAAMAIRRLENAGMTTLDQPRIIVSGANGGVGSIAVRLLVASGYEHVIGVVRRAEQRENVLALGAEEVIMASELTDLPDKPLLSQSYHYAIDTVGGALAGKLIGLLYRNGAIALTGNAGGNELPTTVLPMILRGVTILGIDSVLADAGERADIWARFATDWHVMPELLTETVPFADLPVVLQQFANHQHTGRTVLAFPID